MNFNKPAEEYAPNHSDVFESQYFVNVNTKDGFHDYMRHKMRVYHYNYDFIDDVLVIDEFESDYYPSLEEVYYYCKYVIISSKMEKEIPIMAMVYIERFLTKTGLLMNHTNWRRLIMTALIIASKIWDDDSLENVHFPKVMHDITLKEVNILEKIFLELIDYDLIISGSEYAKYFFILKTFEMKGGRTDYPMMPISVDKMSFLQKNSEKAEIELREMNERKYSLNQTL
jgi:hypothetical protein